MLRFTIITIIILVLGFFFVIPWDDRECKEWTTQMILWSNGFPQQIPLCVEYVEPTEGQTP